MPYYPLYALFFLDTGLSGAQISFLFALWSITAVVAEVPTGLLADRWSRRGSVVLGGVLEAVAFVVWTAAPSFWAFAAGFAIWGLGGALMSGASEALVYDALAAVGAEQAYATVNGRMVSVELLVQLPTAALATGLFALGGYSLVGWASVAFCLAAAALALRFPEAPRRAEGEDDEDVGLLRGAAEALRSPGLRIAVLGVALLGGIDAIEEYFPVLAGEWGVPTTLVPLAVLSTSLAGAAGASLAGRLDRLPTRALLAMLVASALSLTAAALWAHPAALAVLGLSYGLYVAVLVVAEARLQHRITGPHRATITSVASVGVELAGLIVFAAWALGGPVAVAAVILAVVPVVGLGLRRPTSSAAGTPTASSPPPSGSRG